LEDENARYGLGLVGLVLLIGFSGAADTVSKDDIRG